MRTPLAFGPATALTLVALALAPLFAGPLPAPLDPQAAQALAADASLAKVVDREGIGLARAGHSLRWRTAEPNEPLFAGEWLKTGARGAHALELRTKGGARLILGPGAQLELIDAATLRVAAGEVEIGADATQPLTVRGPGETVLTLAAPTVVRATEGRLEALKAEPPWLAGFKAGQPTEALGSLLATIDGREVPLTLGYHKVTVDIRDQIARTVIEESFENHTSTVLEGVFYFPLPADASISSFGMWIGDDLVEADIVEKERARAIYEQILREKRDPGLLEWTGGNLFKARVYPISGEKRIKIGYTQVLKKRDDTFRYHYALQSELLRANPLKQLSIDVHVSSAEPLAAVASPSHSCRVEATAHAATVSFEAQELRPDRDFELRLATVPAVNGGAWRGSPHLSFVDDQRGDDGYFMVRFTAPPAEVCPPPDESVPSDWLLLCDTSGSLRGAARERQLEFLEALLASLGPHDTIQVATCDVATRFAFPAPVFNDEANRAAALKFVLQREALGWSDLAGAFGECFQAMRKETQLVYVGDGIATLGDADPAKCADAITKAFPGRGRVHAVVPGNAQEPLVLRAITRLGDGSLREIGGGSDATQVAAALIADATDWRATDLKVAFDGVPVAAVYPETLPSLAMGEQQIVVGRYDARTARRGTVRVTGRGMAPLELPIVLDDLGEKGSFLPRLWARHHMDHLLAQPASKATREQVLALSEEFQLVSPYASFLVLESEADRERFRVQKQTRMRDGEEFFAKGRTDGDFALAQAQMEKAELWRVGIRRDVLAMLAALDRDLVERLRPQSNEVAWGEDRLEMVTRSFATGGGGGGRGGWQFAGMRGLDARSGAAQKPGAPTGGGWDGGVDKLNRVAANGNELLDFAGGEAEGAASDSDGEDDLGGSDLPPASEQAPEPAATPAPGEASFDDATAGGFALKSRARRAQASAARPMGGLSKFGYLSDLGDLSGERDASRGRDDGRSWYARAPRPAPLDPFTSCLPGIAPPLPPRTPAFDGEVAALLATLDGRARIAALAGGIEVSLRGTTTSRRGTTLSLGEGRALLAADGWWSEPLHRAGDDATIEWWDGAQRGAWSRAWQLGRVRATRAGDAASFPALHSWLFPDLDARFRGHAVTFGRSDDGRVLLHLIPPGARTASGDGNFTDVLIDEAKALVLEERWFSSNVLVHVVRVEESREAAGRWWPTRIVAESPRESTRVEWQLEVTALAAADFAPRLAAALAPRAALIELPELDPTLHPTPAAALAAARQAVADGKAGLLERWLLLSAAAARDEHDATRAAFAEVAALCGGKPGLARLELVRHLVVREHETLRLQLLARAAAEAARRSPGEVARAETLLALAAPLHAGDEQLALLDALTPLFERQPDAPWARFGHARQRLAQLQATPRSDEAYAAAEKLARDFPTEVEAHLTWSQFQAQRGAIDAALRTLADAASKHAPWSSGEQQQLADARVTLLWNGYRLEQLVDETKALLSTDAERVPQQQLDRYLSALVMLDREAAWWSTIEQWLGEARATVRAGRRLGEGEERRLAAAVRHALGQGEGCWWWNRRFEPAEAQLLADTGRELLADERAGRYGAQLLPALGETLEGRAAYAALWSELRENAATAAATRVARFVALLRQVNYQPAGEEATWQALFAALAARAAATSDANERAALETLLLGYAQNALQLDVRRAQLARASSDAEREAAAAALFAALLQEGWSEPFETELRGLIEQVGPGASVELATAATEAAKEAARGRRFARIIAWHDFVDWAIAARAKAAVAALPGSNALPRKKLQLAQEEQTRLARLAVHARLTAELERAPDGEFADWLRLDRAWLDVKLRRDTEPARRELLALLARRLDAAGATPIEELERDALVAAQRAATTLLHLLATAPEAARAEQQREWLALRDAAQATKGALLDWQELDWTRLVALDRGDELVALLERWLGDGTQYALLRFGVDLAWLHAERGELDKAIALGWRLAEKEALGHDDWNALAAWCTARGQQEAAARAQLEAWLAVDADTLQNFLWQQRWQLDDRGDGTPGELSPHTFAQAIAMLRKAEQPSQHLWVIRDLYGRTKEFRLLECLAEGVVGHTAQGIYAFLGDLAALEALIDEEATVDRIAQGIANARPRAKSAVDARALRYLEFLSRWRASAQVNGGAAHATAALAAMKAAFEPAMQPGEGVLLAAFLARLDRLHAPELVAEQLRQLAALLAAEAVGSDARLAVAGALATAEWNANRHDASLRTLQGELLARRRANGDRLPDSANGALATLVERLATRGRFLEAEKLLDDERSGERVVALHASRGHWLEQQLHALFARALRDRGSVSLGSGAELFAKARAVVLERLATRSHEGRAQELVDEFVALCRAAHEVRLPRVGEELEQFAFQQLPRTLAAYQYRNGQSMVANVAQALRDLASAPVAVEFLVTRAETEPRWIARMGQSFFDQQGWQLARWRHEARRLDERLERRLLALVVAELRGEMRHGRQRARGFYDIAYDTFWAAKAADFAAAAKAEHAEGRDDEAVTLRVADYLYQGLKRPAEGVALLRERLRGGRLGLDGQVTFCRWLHEQRGDAEAKPLLLKLIAARPGQLDLRFTLMAVCTALREPAEADAVRAGCESWLRESKQWDVEENVRQLAWACYEAALWEHAAAYYGEAITMRTRSHGARANGDGTLGPYYERRSEALAKLGRTMEAIDAAAGAIVAWGANLDERNRALRTLDGAIASARDLAAVAARIDAEVAASGLENPLLRKSLAKAWRERGELEQAQAQLEAALEAAPDDAEVTQLLLQVHDARRQPEGAIAALFAAMEARPHDLELLVELGARLTRIEQAERAERVHTQLVEAFLGESEGHAALATVREAQKRYREAALQWEQVIRIRGNEPTGWLGLAKSLLAAGDRDAARAPLDKLLSTDWEARFGDVKSEARRLLRR
ncbi:MAG: hypothetical protein JNL90_15695 [Planctomycetes bacterium]|nr:hypothetical protein [Planctomycetota bacterium]